ncbi:MAG: hypothetical protein F7C81_06850 [Desulfurococcales archaeon]|nr:hypothetical protein [Desulfurococcales archaeon]MEB3779812.1 hypothetical protein [Desulfurococcales archaeon]
MAFEDLYQAAEKFKELGVVPNADFGYYLVFAGLILLSILAIGAAIFGLAKATRLLSNMTPSGLLKTLLVVSGIFIFAGLLLP